MNNYPTNCCSRWRNHLSNESGCTRRAPPSMTYGKLSREIRLYTVARHTPNLIATSGIVNNNGCTVDNFFRLPISPPLFPLMACHKEQNHTDRLPTHQLQDLRDSFDMRPHLDARRSMLVDQHEHRSRLTDILHRA